MISHFFTNQFLMEILSLFIFIKTLLLLKRVVVENFFIKTQKKTYR